MLNSVEQLVKVRKQVVGRFSHNREQTLQTLFLTFGVHFQHTSHQYQGVFAGLVEYLPG